MARPSQLHNLRANEGERSPRRIFIYDTETTWTELGDRELHQLRLWEGLLITRTPGRPGSDQVQPYSDAGGVELAELAGSLARTAATTWIMSHNASFDLTVTQLPLGLLSQGWSLTQHNLASESPWARLRRGGHRLRLADTWSWLPVSVATLAELLELQRPELPAGDDSEAVWRARCRADVAITALAITRLMDEWDRLRLGFWSLTGPASGWNSLLHMTPRRHRSRARTAPPAPADDRGGPPVAPIVIDPDPIARAFEREAIFSGRRDLWRWGQLPPQQYAELDFQNAHLSVVAHLPLPDRRSAAFDQLSLEDWHWTNPTRTLLARCRVRVERPRYPLRWRGQLLHPVGEFETVLAGPELREARIRGELLAVGAGHSYRLGTFMQSWGRWGLEVLADTEGRFDPMLQVAVKSWGRKVPGRWAMLVARELGRAPHPHLGWGLEPAAFGTPARHGHLLYLAGERVELVRDQDGEDTFPAILAHIQSWARLLQARMIDRLGEAHLAQVNTDSALVLACRLEELARERWARVGPEPDALGELAAGAREVSEATRPLAARIKAVARGGRILSPQHLEHAGRRKFAGVPATAEEVEPDVFRFQTWPKLKGQIERGDPRGYVRELRKVDLRALTPNRWVYEDGCCEPVRATWSPESGTALLPAAPGGCPGHGEALRALQHPLLRGLR